MKKIRVLVIDDSAFARKVIREVLSRDPEIEVVGIARDGLEGLEKIGELRPDVVTLDMVMPELDGLGVLEALKSIWSPKVIIVSVSGSETELGLEALKQGAVDVVTKPTPHALDKLYSISNNLLEAVKAAALAIVPSPVLSIDTQSLPPLPKLNPNTKCRLVVMGTSTGGPQAIAQFVKMLPHGFPAPIAIALHIPAGYTAPLAERISQATGIKMWEAQNGMLLNAGEVYIAPGGMHLSFNESEGKLYAVVSREPTDTLHHPSVDILFESAANVVGKNVIGIILTGMGSDGLMGSQRLREKGAKILAESESSCVVYGMPRSVIEGGAATGQTPLENMPQLLLENL